MFRYRSDEGLRVVVAERSCVDDKAEQEMKAFYQHLIQHSQSKVDRTIITGSTCEIPGQEHILDQHGLSQELLDIDIMFRTTDIYVTTNRETAPDQFNDQVVRIYSRGMHSGYVKLFDVDVTTEFKRTDVKHPILGGVLRGPADTLNHANLREQSKILQSFISKEHWMAPATSNVMQDRVIAVHSRYWPLEINEWITRQRLYCLPSKSTIKQVVQYGCDFVQVSHKLNTNINDWRFSFSKAELIIIQSWTSSQRCVYRTLHTVNKMIKSKMKESKLCTYYYKTLMLWATEEKPAQLWSEHVLVNSVYELLCELLYCLKRKFCPNYFIPTNNMIDHLTDSELSEDIDALFQLLQDQYLIVDVLSNSRSVEACVTNGKYYIKVPIWLYASLPIWEQLKFPEDIVTRLFTKSSQPLIDRAMSFELSDIYLGLYNYVLAGNCLIQSDNYYLRKSIDHFHCYGDSHSSQATVVVFCSWTVAWRVIPSWFEPYKADNSASDSLLMTQNALSFADTLNVLNVDNSQINEKGLLYSQSMYNVDKTMTTDVYFNENIYGNNKATITVYQTLTVDNETCTNTIFYKEFPRMSPTVNISWFISNAYLVNLYYVTRWNYRATEEMCDNITHVFKQSMVNNLFVECTLPMILSTEWTSVYDDELQAMLGLYSLCSFMSLKTDRSRSVYLGVCPVEFALYLKCRCAADQMDITNWNKCLNDTNEHLKCRGDKRVFNGRLTLNASVMVVRQTFK